jgi:hypothetical protein
VAKLPKYDIGAMSIRIELLVRRALERPDHEAASAWYADANAWCQSMADDLRVPLSVVVGFVSAMSPRNAWAQQKHHTLSQLTCALLGKPIPHGGTNANKRKAQRIASGEEPLSVLGGSKVRAFYSAILSSGYCDAVVIDVHAWSAATGRRDGVVPIRGYRAASESFRLVAERMHIRPCEAQALAWVEWRRLPLEGSPIKGTS